MSRSGVFICPSCQAVVRSEKTPEEGLICPECHQNFGNAPREADPEPPQAAARLAPAPRIGRVPKGKSTSIVRDLTAKRAPVVKTPKASQPNAAIPAARSLQDQADHPTEAVHDTDEEIIMPDGSRKVRRRKKRQLKEKNRPLMLFLIGWLSVVIIIFALFKSGRGASDSDDPENTPDFTQTRNRIFFDNHKPEIVGNVVGFLRGRNEEERIQYIDLSADLALPFARYYRRHSFPEPELPIGMVASNVIEISKEPLVLAIESIWMDSAKHRFGAVHFYDGRGWKLDWECFAPYSTDAWTRFRAQASENEGEFRVLVRKRRSNDESKYISLSFYRAPALGDEGNEFTKTGSPSVEVPVDSQNGIRFLELWKQFEDGKSPYDSLLPKIDPEGFMRIHVKLAWEETDRKDVNRLVLKDILGTAWYGRSILEAKQSADEAPETEEVPLSDDGSLLETNTIESDE